MIGPNSVLLAYPRQPPSLRVDVRPLIQRTAAINETAEKSKQPLKVRKFQEAWRHHEEQESRDEVEESPMSAATEVSSPDVTPLSSTASAALASASPGIP